MYQRKLCSTIASRLDERRKFMQILIGPRQVGKSTAVQQVLASTRFPTHYASADEPQVRDRVWLEQQWELARLSLKRPGDTAILALDEIQKTIGWSEVVKRLWDEDTYEKRDLRVVLLGSSALLLQKGLTESLAGRFELIHAPHWSLSECEKAFGWDPDTFIYYGGYPGAAALVDDRERWARYILDSLIETTVSRDILLLARVDKPALLRQLFHLACTYSGQILSYQKMIGQLQDAGNTTTLAHYLRLLDGAGLVTGLEKFSANRVRQRSSSPKLQAYNTALITAQGELPLKALRARPDLWGRLVESAVGAHLANSAKVAGYSLHYWRDRNREVDFVIRLGDTTAALEVKTGRVTQVLPGMDLFRKSFPNSRPLLIGGDGMPIAEFLRSDVKELLR